MEVRDVAAGLWIWRVEHPRWKPGQGWEPVVASTCVEAARPPPAAVLTERGVLPAERR